MIWIPERNIVLITPGRCGSTTMHRHLCEQHRHGVYVVGPEAFDPELVGKHTPHVPSCLSDCRAFVLVRNPYTRAKSLYNWHVRWCEANEREAESPEEWFDGPMQETAFCDPVSTVVDMSKLDGYWQIENIDDCMRQFNLPAVEIRENCVPGLSELTPQHRELVADWARVDCEAFGY